MVINKVIRYCYVWINEDYVPGCIYWFWLSF